MAAPRLTRGQISQLKRWVRDTKTSQDELVGRVISTRATGALRFDSRARVEYPLRARQQTFHVHPARGYYDPPSGQDILALSRRTETGHRHYVVTTPGIYRLTRRCATGRDELAHYLRLEDVLQTNVEPGALYNRRWLALSRREISCFTIDFFSWRKLLQRARATPK